MRVASLRIDGFKSFAEAVELPLPGGLVGVIGPNGAGKSNVTEAMRWAMGGVSARALRANDMASVVFGGSERRRSRSSAEVTLTLQDDDGRLPAPWTGRTIEAGRRVVRGQATRGGETPAAVSTYRIDGDVVSAAEAQAIFAAAGTGSGSVALVRQGRIAELISGRAQDRRSLLEEAAGVAGVDQRRKEATRRLDAADRDLARHADLIAELRSRRDILTEQAEKAETHAALTKRADAAQAAMAGLDIREAEATSEKAAGIAAAASEDLARLTTAASEAKAALEQRVVAAKAQWRKETEAAEEARRADAALRGVEDALARAEKDLTRLEAQAAALARDVAREGAMAEEAEGQAAALAERLSDLAGQDESKGAPAIEGLRAKRQQADAALATARHDLEQTVADAARRDAEREGLAVAAREAVLDLTDARGRVQKADARLSELPQGEPLSEDERDVLQSAVSAATHELSVAQAERAALARLIGRSDGSDAPEGVRVDPGFEAALIAAIGDEAGRSWSPLGAEPIALPALPKGATPLTEHVAGPAELSRRLSAVGIAEAGQAPHLVAQLAPGQILVSRAGELWSWDGSVVEAGSASAAGARLAQRRRLEEIDEALSPLRAAVDEAKGALRTADRRAGEAESWQRAAVSAGEARQRLTAAEKRQAEIQERIEAADAPEAQASKEALEAKRQIVREAEEHAGRARQDLAEAEAEQRVRIERVRATRAEHDGWQERARAARGREQEARAALAEAERAREAARGLPEALTPQRAALATDLDRARAAHHAVRQEGEEGRAALQEAEAARGNADRDQKDAEAAVARAEATASSAAGALASLRHAAAEGHGSDDPAALIASWTKAGGETDPTRPGLARAEKTAIADRDALGPVNLAAAEELAALEGRIEGMLARRREIEAASATLRRITEELEAASRKRVLDAYDVVAKNFASLFAFLFGGGQARLELVGDDPLEAGLEVMAQPPGKQLTSLSLLSGGEQTLTALALVMAVFQARPAPVCVLDEVDAPLDGRNTDRYCRLLEAVSADAPKTTFLVVTHHPTTTAAMDYLCAVRMDEPGVTSLSLEAVPGRVEARAERAA